MKKQLTRRENSHAGSHSAAVRLALALSTLFAQLLLPARVANGYASDAPGDSLNGSQTRSTFHFDLTLVLARAAGFSNSEAHQLAAMTEAVDDGSYVVRYTDASGAEVTFSIYLENTKRIEAPADANTFYYHWGRRPEFYPGIKGALYPYESGTPITDAPKNTCDYFTGFNDCAPVQGETPCYVSDGKKVGEVETLHHWAVEDMPEQIKEPYPEGGGPNSPPKWSLTGEPDDYIAVDVGMPPSRLDHLVALGILLHALGDSYSHEICFRETCPGGNCIRTHINTSECGKESCGGLWHSDEELYNPASSGDDAAGSARGVTQVAAAAVWKALSDYRREHELPAASWPAGVFNFASFIRQFVIHSKSGPERQEIAARQLARLNQADAGWRARKSPRRAAGARRNRR